MQVAHGIAWLREQAVPRLGMTAFRGLISDLQQADHDHSAAAGSQLMTLRWNARLATRESLPPPIRIAEATAVRSLFATCPPATGDAAVATRILCLGRVVDELRRLGYLDALSHVPEIAHELADLRRDLDHFAPAQRNQAHVGLPLVTPPDLALQRLLLAQRRDLALDYPDLPK